MATIQELMQNVNGATFIGLNTVTPVKLRGGKKNPLQGRVTKVTTGSNVMVFQNKTTNGYENMVNRRLAQEGKANDFTVGPRAWGERVDNTPFVVHNEQLYLEVIFLKCGKVEYHVDGVLHEGPIEGLDTDHEEAEQGGLENKVIIRTYKVANIVSIAINNEVHVL